MRKITFPQANSLEKIITTIKFLKNKKNVSDLEIANYLGYKGRQGAYYSSTCYYFGIVDENNSLTSIGKNLFTNDDLDVKKLYFHILTDPIFSNIFHAYILKYDEDLLKYAQKLINEHFIYSLSVTNRRASTAVSWIKMICDYIKNI